MNTAEYSTITQRMARANSVYSAMAKLQLLAADLKLKLERSAGIVIQFEDHGPSICSQTGQYRQQWPEFSLPAKVIAPVALEWIQSEIERLEKEMAAI